MPTAGACPPLLGLDIETDTSVDGLDPATSAVLAVAVAHDGGVDVFDGPEAPMLAALDGCLGELPPGVLVTWNGAAFDLPFLAVRARACGVQLRLRLRHDPAIPTRSPPLPGSEGAYRAAWHRHGHLDGYRLYRADAGRTLGLSCGLKPLARLVGLETVEVERSAMHELGAAELRRYVASDAALARALVARRLPAALACTDRF